jgi:hypothetical protein
VVSFNRTVTVFKATPVLSWDFPLTSRRDSAVFHAAESDGQRPGTFTYETARERFECGNTRSGELRA